MAVLTSISLSVTLSTSEVKRFIFPLLFLIFLCTFFISLYFLTPFRRLHLSPPARFSSLRQFSHWRFVPRLQNRRRSFVRSMFAGEEQEAVVPASVPVRVAHELLQAGHRYLDVRTVDEFNAGHVVGATNIPFMLKVESGMTKNPNFLEEVSKIFGKDDEILIGCQSGKRSLMAASELSFAGFTGLTNVAGGYASWVQNNLPIE